MTRPEIGPLIGRMVGSALLALALAAGCAPTAKEGAPLARLAPGDHPRFVDDMALDGLGRAVDQSLAYLGRVPPDRTYTVGETTYTARKLAEALSDFRRLLATDPDADALSRFIRSRFVVYRSAGRPETGKVLYTGYFEPLLRGSTLPGPVHRYPVHARPDDLSVVDLSRFSSELSGKRIIGRVSGKTFVPYHDRREIMEEAALADKAEVLAWVDDRVDLFFLHIQGSGKIALAEGGVLNVHYNAKNGRPYRSIGQVLIDEGKVPLEEMSMQRIRAYLERHPGEVSRILNANPSYIFFSLEAEGPKGALNVVLTPGRSLAVDRTIFPMAALAFVRTEKPLVDGTGEIIEWTSFSRFFLNQDTGGAIKGPGRADIFWGSGAYAETAAGHLRHPGELFVLAPAPEDG